IFPMFGNPLRTFFGCLSNHFAKFIFGFLKLPFCKFHNRLIFLSSLSIIYMLLTIIGNKNHIEGGKGFWQTPNDIAHKRPRRVGVRVEMLVIGPLVTMGNWLRLL